MSMLACEPQFMERIVLKIAFIALNQRHVIVAQHKVLTSKIRFFETFALVAQTA